MKEVFLENFSFIVPFKLTLWLFKVLQIVQKFHFQRAFIVSLTKAIEKNKTKTSKTIETKS